MLTSIMNNFFLISGVFASTPEQELPFVETGKNEGEICYAEVDDDPFFSCIEVDDDPCEEYPYCVEPYRIYLSHIEAKGIGYKKGYSTLGLFLGFGEMQDVSNSKLEPFLDVKSHLFNDGRFAGNLGLGIRKIDYCDCVWGINAYYDWRHGRFGHYQQVGGGFEVLQKHLSFRANIYWPVGKRVHYSSKSSVFSGYDGGYELTCRQVEKAGRGADAEFGYFMGRYSEGVGLYAGIGPYFFERHTKDVVGGMGRIIFQGYEFLALEGRFSYDRVNHGIAQIRITLSYPFGERDRSQLVRRSRDCYCEDIGRFKEIALQPTLRNEIIFLNKRYQCWLSNH